VFAAKIKKEVRSIESEKGKERKLSQLLLKYGDLNLVQGIFTAYRVPLFLFSPQT
jgi:hypothetical protein